LALDATSTPAPIWRTYSSAQRWGFLAILFLVSMSNYVDRQVMSVLIEPIKAEFQVSDAAMGLLTGFAFAAFYAVLGLPIARLADRGDRRLIITVSILIWSVMTMVCGLARSFTVLALSRTGVGIGEAGALPPAQSLIADYFPPAQRTRALSIFLLSAMAGYLIAFAGGAQIAAAYGWRAALIALGAPGLLLALVTLFLSEPRRRRGYDQSAAVQEPLGVALSALVRKPSYLLVNVAAVLYFFVAYGAVTWFPAYLGRVLHLKLTEIGAWYGILGAAGALVGNLAGGFITDTLAQRDVRWLARAPGLILILCTPLYLLAITSDSPVVFFAVSFIGGIGLSASVPALFSVVHAVCGSARRAMSVAILLFWANLIGLGCGPLVTGALSDLFTARLGPVGLRWALAAALTILVPTGLALWASERTLVRDMEA
jgi:predicted MFS family arabinose efflux permease